MGKDSTGICLDFSLCAQRWREQGVPEGAPGAQHPAASFPLLSAGQQEHGGLRARHLSNIQQKSLSFLQSLKVCPIPFCQAKDCCVPFRPFLFGVSWEEPLPP